MANVTISMDSILYSLGFLSSRNKRWLAKHLIEQAAQEDAKAKTAKLSDEEFFKDLFSTPYDNSISAEEAKRIRVPKEDRNRSGGWKRVKSEK